MKNRVLGTTTNYATQNLDPACDYILGSSLNHSLCPFHNATLRTLAVMFAKLNFYQAYENCHRITCDIITTATDDPTIYFAHPRLCRPGRLESKGLAVVVKSMCCDVVLTFAQSDCSLRTGVRCTAYLCISW